MACKIHVQLATVSYTNIDRILNVIQYITNMYAVHDVDKHTKWQG